MTPLESIRGPEQRMLIWHQQCHSWCEILSQTYNSFSILNDGFTDAASACTTSKTRIAPSIAISTMVCSLELSMSEKGRSSSRRGLSE